MRNGCGTSFPDLFVEKMVEQEEVLICKQARLNPFLANCGRVNQVYERAPTSTSETDPYICSALYI